MCGKGFVQILQLTCFMILDGGLVGLPPFPQALLLLLNVGAAEKIKLNF